MLKVPLFFTAEAICRNQPRNRAFRYESGVFWNAFGQLLPEIGRLEGFGHRREEKIGTVASPSRVANDPVASAHLTDASMATKYHSRALNPARPRSASDYRPCQSLPTGPLETAVRKGIWADH